MGGPALYLGGRVAVAGTRSRRNILLILAALWAFCPADIQASAAPSVREVPFGGREIHSTHISPFFKWTGVTARIDADKPSRPVWPLSKEALKILPLVAMAKSVNNRVNSYAYMADIFIWGVSDYWASPTEFFVKGGDCEDFAIAKYAWLRLLGVPEDRLRIAIVHDRIRNIPHAILILYVNEKAMILDSQVRDIRDSRVTSRYRMLYSLNRTGWWLPRQSDPLVAYNADTAKSLIEPAAGDEAIYFSDDCLAGRPLPECINATEPAAGQ